MCANTKTATARRALRSARASLLALLACCALLPLAADAVIIPRTIVVDGDVSDWEAVDLNGDSDTNDAGEGSIITNPGQFSEDKPGTAGFCGGNPADNDLDCVVQATGRDLEYFAFTFDDDFLYMYVRRYASTSNATEWFFYLDLDANGLMEDGEKVLHVQWQGSNGKTGRELFDYQEDAPGGDPLTQGGTADGYTMPGGVTPNNPPDLTPVVNGGATTGPFAGVAMETRVRWDDLDPSATGPFSLGFHISSANSTNIPNQIDDNMNGPDGGGGGGTFQFSNPGLVKTGDAVGVGGEPIEYTVTITNTGPDAATGIEVTDACEDLEIVSRDAPFGPSLLAGESLVYDSHMATNGNPQYDDGTGIWSIASLANGASETLTLSCTANIDEPIRVRNNAEITALDTIDTDLSDNEAASGTTVVEPAPDLLILKSSTVTHDPVNEGSNPKRIPSGCVTYEIRVINSGRGRAQNVEITDALPGGTVLYTGDFENGATECGGTGVTATTDSPVFWDEDDSGLNFSFVSLSDGGDSFEFQDGSTPTPASITPNGGFDPAVRRIVISPAGTMLGQCCGNGTTDGQHEFLVRYRVQIQ